MEIFGFIFLELILSGLGWLCLMIWYRDRKKVKEIRDKKYAGEYSTVVKILTLNVVAATGAVVMTGAVIFVMAVGLYRIFAE